MEHVMITICQSSSNLLLSYGLYFNRLFIISKVEVELVFKQHVKNHDGSNQIILELKDFRLKLRKGEIKDLLPEINSIFLQYPKETLHPHLKALYNIQAVAYAFQGLHRDAIQVYDKLLEILTSDPLDKDSEMLGITLANKGRSYHFLGEHDLAERFLIDSITIFGKTNLSYRVSNVLAYLIMLYDDVENVKKLHTTYNKLIQLHQAHNFESQTRTTLLKSLCDAKIHHRTNRCRDKCIAEKLYREITKNEHDVVLALEAHKSLFELLFDEFQIYGSQEIIMEMKEIMTSMEDIAFREHLVIRQIESKRMGARLEVILDNVSMSRQSLNEALSIAKNYSISYYITQLENDINNVENQLEQVRQLKNKYQVETLKQTRKQIFDYIKLARTVLIQEDD